MKLPFQLPLRALQTHKGQCGRVLVIAGSPSMVGSGIMTARAAFRMGSGLVHLMTVDEPSISVQYPELITFPLSKRNETISEASVFEALQYCLDQKINVVAIGPGLGLAPETRRFIRGLLLELISRTRVFIVVDADALNAMDPSFLVSCEANRLILTPHPGEFMSLFGHFPKDRFAFSKKIALHYKQWVVLKSFETVVTDGDRVYTNTTGNPGMATAGSGDILTGVIASLIGQGMGPYEAACLGVYLHGFAGDKAFEVFGIGLMATDLLPYLAKGLEQ